MKFFQTFSFLMIFLLSFQSSAIAEFGVLGSKNKVVTVELISEEGHIVPGKEAWVGFKFDLEEKWHIYWKNVGATGLPTRVTWDLPEGVTASELLWPVPERFDTAGLVSFGYHDQVMLMSKLTLDKNHKLGSTLNLKAKVSWLECKSSCKPGRSSVELALPIDGSSNGTSNHQPLFDQYRQLLPKENQANYAYKAKDQFVVGLKTDLKSEKINFFPFAKDAINYEVAPSVFVKEGNLEIKLSHGEEENSKINGVFRIETEGKVQAFKVDTELSAAPPHTTQQTSSAEAGEPSFDLLGAILFAFLGGLILNIMPCVLPVLSVKILQILSHAGDQRSKIFLNSLSYTFGVLVSFWVLAGVLIGLRQAGEELGWGFQMQSPFMLTILMAVFFIFGLNLFGVFEIGVGLVGVDQKAKSKNGYLGAFLSGVLATVAATPCTAPYMGTALAYAITQPVMIAMAVFTGLGLGMASPFILAGIFPKVMSFLPKPGAWMNTFKQFLGFLLMATVAYLFYVYTTVVKDQERVMWMGMCLVLFSMSAWIWGKWSYGSSGKAWLAKCVALGLVIVGFKITGETIKAFEWEEFDQAKITEHLEKGTPVFLDFTASWCLSCKVNEKTVLETSTTAQLFDQHKVVPMKADWTQYSPKITKALEALGRNSVPVYVVYNPNNPNEPEILPEVLTHGIMKKAISSLNL